MSQPCTVLGIDGPVLSASLPGDGCCPPTICDIEPNGFACQFLNVLPSGPLWDAAKRDGLASIRAQPSPCAVSNCPPEHCSSIVDHARYAAFKLWSYARMFLQPVAVEGSPFTAVSSLDFWLESLGWNDCSQCEGEPSITTVLSQCSEPLALAVKRGIATALQRLTLAPIPTVAAINFVINPLGVYLQPEISSDPWASMPNNGEPQAIDMRPGDQRDCGCVAWDCADQGSGLNCVIRPLLRFSLRLHSRTLKAVKSPDCGPGKGCPPGKSQTPCNTCSECELVEGYFDPNAGEVLTAGLSQTSGGATTRLWPGVMAALCIVRTMLPEQANYSIEIKVN
jgi:hypothetical protein